MTDKLKLGTILSFIFLVTSCDCVVDHQGYVRDSQTEKPIPYATVKFDKREYKTDTTGYFRIHYITGFCPDWDFQIEMENYKTQKVKMEREGNEIIYRVQTDNDNDDSIELNSLNFKVKDDTIHFYLTNSKENESND